MPPVTVLILAPEPAAGAGPLERLLDEARTALGEHHRLGFLAAGADAVEVVREPPDDTPFGSRLRRLVEALAPAGGLVVLGAASVPLATELDRRAFVAAAASSEPGALVNVRHSADVVAVARAAEALRDLPPGLRSDNALPRWLEERAGIPVRDLRARRRLAMDVDSPLDLLLLEGVAGAPGLPAPAPELAAPARERLAAVRALAADPGAEVLVAGRTSAADLRWAERHTRSRTRALVEERGLRTATSGPATGLANRRPARSVLGLLLDRDGPGSLGALVAALADGALVDSRVLLAHRHGADERAWPSAEDRFASDLLLADRIRDPWLAALTASAAGAAVPVVLGAHSLVGPGLSLARAGAGPVAASIAGVDLQPGYRRDPLPDPDAVGEDVALVAMIREEIRADGSVTFARFMERALYEPGHGYYRRPEPGPGLAGADFLTAPEAHPIAGAAVGRLLEQAWEAMGRPSPFVVTEAGAGTGAMAAGLLVGLRDLGSPLLDAIRYRPLEVEETRVGALRSRLAAAGLDGHLAGDGEPATTGALVANEVLDALPVHRVIGRPRGLRELLVGLDASGAFAWEEAEPTTPALATRLATEGVALADGQVTEICLAIDDWLARATAGLERGVVVIVDYAAEPGDLHGPGRPTGTLRAFARHAVGADPFVHVGRQDLTATVDLDAVRTAAERTGLEPLGETTQAELLARTGGSELVDTYLRKPGATLQDALDLRSALARLLDPRGLGGFRVLAFGRGLRPGTRLPAMDRITRPGS